MKKYPAMALLALMAAACDFPTAPPILEPRFVIPESGTTLSVNELLPPGVVAVGNAFRVAVAPVSFNRTLGQVCGQPCVAAAGQQVPKPAFTDAFQVNTPLPSDVPAATLAAGTLTVTAWHTFGFDLLRPQGRTQDGTMTMTVRSAGRVLGSATVNQAFPSGSANVITRVIPLAAGPVTTPIEVEVTISSPAGGTVTINPNAALNVNVVPSQMDVSQATVRAESRQVSAAAVSLDLSSVGDYVRERVRSGAVILNISNPLDAEGTLQLRFAGVPVADKTVQVGPGATTQRVEFTPAELQAMLGNVVTLNIAGPVTGRGPGSTLTVVPGQQVAVTTLLDLVLALGG